MMAKDNEEMEIDEDWERIERERPSGNSPSGSGQGSGWQWTREGKDDKNDDKNDDDDEDMEGDSHPTFKVHLIQQIRTRQITEFDDAESKNWWVTKRISDAWEAARKSVLRNPNDASVRRYVRPAGGWTDEQCALLAGALHANPRINTKELLERLRQKDDEKDDKEDDKKDDKKDDEKDDKKDDKNGWTRKMTMDLLWEGKSPLDDAMMFEDGKKAAKIMEGVLRPGDKGYQEARQEILEGLKAQSSLAEQEGLARMMEAQDAWMKRKDGNKDLVSDDHSMDEEKDDKKADKKDEDLVRLICSLSLMI